jgi:serine/threonine protein kinase
MTPDEIPTTAADGAGTPAPGDEDPPSTQRRGDQIVPGYELTALLGRGGFGEVWRAEGPGGVRVAMKVILLDGGGAAAEAKALGFIKDLTHSNLIGIFGIWNHRDRLIIGMELAERTLEDRLREAKGQGHEGIPFDELIGYMKGAARAIDFLNEPRHASAGGSNVGIVHRDIKPRNLLLVGGGVKVADFGLARTIERSLTNTTGGWTLSYAAPELFQGQVSRHTDQYSLAVSYAQLRCGRLPFRGDHLQVMAGHLLHPPDLSGLPEAERAVVARALAKEPPGRWGNCGEFVDRLAAREHPAPRTGGPALETPPPADEPARGRPSNDPHLAETLRSEIDDADPGVRTRALRIVGVRGVSGLIDLAIARMLDDADSDVRAAAAWAIDQLDDPAAIPALLKALHDPSWGVRSDAGWALVHLGPQVIPAVREVHETTKNGAAREMAKLVLDRL